MEFKGRVFKKEWSVVSNGEEKREMRKISELAIGRLLVNSTAYLISPEKLG